MALVCHAGLQDSEERSRANSQGMLCWRCCSTSPGRNPALFSSTLSVFQLLECSASLLCHLLQFLTCLKRFLPSVHTEEERGSCLGLCSTAVSFGICVFCFSPEQGCCGRVRIVLQMIMLKVARGFVGHFHHFRATAP